MYSCVWTLFLVLIFKLSYLFTLQMLPPSEDPPPRVVQPLLPPLASERVLTHQAHLTPTPAPPSLVASSLYRIRLILSH